MNSPKSILVVISGRRKTHEALERALMFAQHSNAHIHIFNCIYEPVMELTDVLSSEHRKELKSQYLADRYLYMDELASEVEEKGVKCSALVTWQRNLHEAIEQAAAEIQPDLVIKRISADNGSLNPFAMPVDRHLLRFCPAPLLLIKQAEWSKGPIIAAVDPHASDQKHQQLNQQIIGYSKKLADMIGSTMLVVSSYIVPSMSPAIGLPGVDYDLIRKDTFKLYEQKMRALVEAHAVPLDKMHIIEGHAEHAIPNFVEESKAQLVVLGTVGRTGISAAFIGNTAEHILAELTCDVLALQPTTGI